MFASRICRNKSQLRCVLLGSHLPSGKILLGVPRAGLKVSVQRDPLFRLWTWSLLLVALGLTPGGCNKSPFKLNPVHGQVFFKDQPLEGAQIVFQPAGGTAKEQPMAYGTAAADGSFDLSTHPHGPGAVAGDYVVFITSYGVDPKNPEKKVSKLPAKYADQANPLLKATVKEGKNDLEPFRLK